MFDIVAKQGKHRNPWTGSGGMLLGTVEKIGDALKDKIDLKPGDKIATLVSLSLTPLRIDKITRAVSTPRFLQTCPRSSLSPHST